ncbi:MAG TPA: helix-turn-helix domain-containing protein [Candidatus Acidoferrales bacterium]|nr:helix-turn-helix domain-containing protein [Candidatus Acidoferrales bacterium]
MNEAESSQKIRPRCEIIVQYVLPAIRAEIAARMRDEGISQARIARMLGVTPAAVSQYIKSKRGAVGQDVEVLTVIDDYIEKYRNDPDELSAHLCDVCNKIKLVFDKRATEDSISPACCS